MNFTSVPIITVLCYLSGELYKIFFSKRKELYRFIPVIMCILGGILGVICFYVTPEMIFNAENIWIALGIGIVSGASATCTNQIIKQLFGNGSSDSTMEDKK